MPAERMAVETAARLRPARCAESRALATAVRALNPGTALVIAAVALNRGTALAIAAVTLNGGTAATSIMCPIVSAMRRPVNPR